MNPFTTKSNTHLPVKGPTTPTPSAFSQLYIFILIPKPRVYLIMHRLTLIENPVPVLSVIENYVLCKRNPICRRDVRVMRLKGLDVSVSDSGRWTRAAHNFFLIGVLPLVFRPFFSKQNVCVVPPA